MTEPALEMEYWFSACEAAEFAAEVEKQGNALYRRLAGELAGGPVRDMFLFFAQQEDEHQRIFRGIADHFRGLTVAYAYSVDIAAMLHASLQAIVTVFANQDSRPPAGGSVATCLDLARRIEETSVKVYGHMRLTYTERFSEVLGKIVAEEEKHLRMVNQTLARL